ncbi:MAG: Flp family type IVb pilin [Phycisphaerae bacterium]|nr:Flp family type IVb pilin [Phycisphaerae bacterium]
MKILEKLKSLHHDEQGADLIEYVLIIAVIALPLIGVMIWFKDDISEWFATEYGEYKDGGEGTNPLD